MFIVNLYLVDSTRDGRNLVLEVFVFLAVLIDLLDLLVSVATDSQNGNLDLGLFTVFDFGLHVLRYRYNASSGD